MCALTQPISYIQSNYHSHKCTTEDESSQTSSDWLGDSKSKIFNMKTCIAVSDGLSEIAIQDFLKIKFGPVKKKKKINK